MGFAEALSDDGSMTGRGTPWLRGPVCGVMTTLGGIGHTLPYLVPDFVVCDAYGPFAKRVSYCDDNRGRDRILRALGNCVDSHAVHGHAVPPRSLPSGGRRRARIPHGHCYREFVIKSSRNPLSSGGEICTIEVDVYQLRRD